MSDLNLQCIELELGFGFDKSNAIFFETTENILVLIIFFYSRLMVDEHENTISLPK